jgi:ADP-heptose:LPS heptosyltransferase
MLHPGAGGAAKCWAPEGFATVAETLVAVASVDLVVHEGPADREAVGALLARLHGPVSRLVEPSLETLAGALRHVALWIGNDSGVSHLAAAVGAPTLALFAEANVRWRPWRRDAGVRVVARDASRPDTERVTTDAVTRLGIERRAAAGGAR